MEVQQLYNERQAAGCADKETRRMQSKSRRKRGQVRALLDEVYVWQSLGAGDHDGVARLSEQEVKQLWTPGARPPWGTEASSMAAVRHYHGRGYHSQHADLSRVQEEEVILRVEKQRLARWLCRTDKQLQQARGRPEGVCDGIAFLIDRHVARIRTMQAQLSASCIPNT